MKVSMDGTEADAQPDSTVGSVAQQLGIKLTDGCIVAVRRVVELEKVQTNFYEIDTSRGKMMIRLECDKILDGWRRSFKRFEGSGIRWISRDAAVFGPILTDFEPSDQPVELKQDEIALSLSGFSNENTHIVFSRRIHTAAYDPPRGCGVVGRVVYGRHILDEFRTGDKIIKIDPVIETKEGAGAVVRADDSYKLDEPVQVTTKLRMELDPASPMSGELVYKTTGRGTMKVTRTTSVFMACDGTNVLSLPVERQAHRARTSFTVRNSGSNAGSVYIYRKDAALTPSHNIAGKVTSGMDLADVAAEGDLVATEVFPAALEILGITQSQAAGILNSHEIRQVRSGDASDAAVVVENSPATTLEAYAKKEVDCHGIKASELVKVRLFQKEAPISVRYFRRLTGLDLRKIGKMTVYFATPKMEIVLFKGDELTAKELLPENMPTGTVGPLVIGVTNAVKRYAGMAGVRFVESKEFGPTAEKFEGTNIIGEVVGNAEALRGLTERKVVYVLEV